MPTSIQIPDRVVHFLLFTGGMFLASFLKMGFDKLANHTWRKIDAEASDFKEFKKWQKAKKKHAGA